VSRFPLRVALIALPTVIGLATVGCGSASNNSGRTRSGSGSSQQTARASGPRIVGCWMNTGQAEADVVFPPGTPAKGSDIPGAVYVEALFLGPGGTYGAQHDGIATATVYAGSVPSSGVQVLGKATSGSTPVQANTVTGCRIEQQYENRHPNSNAPTVTSSTPGPTVPFGTRPPSEFNGY
jgi:hypothetical protein